MLGRQTEKGLWPQPKNSNFTREYSGESKTFLHSESVDLGTRWELIVNPESNKLMKIQQKELFRWICEESGAEIDEESLTIGQIKLNGIKSHNDKSINEMKKMSLYANQHDHEAIVELAYAPNHNGDAWLGIDGFEKRTDVPRSRIVSINPRGEFIRRAIRKNEANTILYSPSDSNEKVVIFSIDPVSIDGKFYRCLSSLHAEFFLDFGYSNLYKLDSGGNELRFKLDEEWLTNLLCNAPLVLNSLILQMNKKIPFRNLKYLFSMA